MHKFDLRPVDGGFELKGGQLSEPLLFLEPDPQPAVHLVGFLSQKLGSELQTFDAAGELIQRRHYTPILPIGGAVGGLAGPS